MFARDSHNVAVAESTLECINHACRLGISRCCHLLTCTLPSMSICESVWLFFAAFDLVQFSVIIITIRRSSRLNNFPRTFIDYWNLHIQMIFSLSLCLQAMLVFKSVYLLITILVFRTSCVNGAEKSKKTVLNIGGIFPILGKGGWQGGQGEN